MLSNPLCQVYQDRILSIFCLGLSDGNSFLNIDVTCTYVRHWKANKENDINILTTHTSSNRLKIKLKHMLLLYRLPCVVFSNRFSTLKVQNFLRFFIDESKGFYGDIFGVFSQQKMQLGLIKSNEHFRKWLFLRNPVRKIIICIIHGPEELFRTLFLSNLLPLWTRTQPVSKTYWGGFSNL